jgi:hypothetical protein
LAFVGRGIYRREQKLNLGGQVFFIIGGVDVAAELDVRLFVQRISGDSVFSPAMSIETSDEPRGGGFSNPIDFDGQRSGFVNHVECFVHYQLVIVIDFV